MTVCVQPSIWIFSLFGCCLPFLCIPLIDCLARQKLSYVSQVLQLIHRREIIVMYVFALTHDFANGQLTTVGLQNKVVPLLCALQKVGLKIVEGILRWRQQLTRPYSFMFQGVNYLLKMLADNHLVATSQLSKVLSISTPAHCKKGGIMALDSACHSDL